MMSRQYASFTKEFKLETLRLTDETELSIAQFARNLGIRRNMIYKWREEMKKQQGTAFKRTVSQADSNDTVDTMADLIAENKRLKKALELSQMEAEILKKAEAYFKNEKS
jgi:transposase